MGVGQELTNGLKGVGQDAETKKNTVQNLLVRFLVRYNFHIF